MGGKNSGVHLGADQIIRRILRGGEGLTFSATDIADCGFRRMRSDLDSFATDRKRLKRGWLIGWVAFQDVFLSVSATPQSTFCTTSWETRYMQFGV